MENDAVYKRLTDGLSPVLGIQALHIAHLHLIIWEVCEMLRVPVARHHVPELALRASGPELRAF